MSLIHAHTDVYMHVCARVSVLCICVCVHTVHVSMYVCMYVCHACMHMDHTTYIYAHVFMHV